MKPIRIPAFPRINAGLARLAASALIMASIAACATVPPGNRAQPQASAPPDPPVIDNSLKDIGIASPTSLIRAVTALGESTEGYSIRGLELAYVADKMIEILYPVYQKPEYVVFPPAASIYPDLFKQVQNGVFPKVKQSDVSFLTTIIPPLAILYTDSRDVADTSLEALDHAEALNPSSVLPPYLKGVIAVRENQWGSALSEFDRALSIDSSCYPATIGKAQVLIHDGQYADASALLEGLAPEMPPDARTLAMDAQAQYSLGDYSKSKELIDRSLALDAAGRGSLLLSARIENALKNYQAALDSIAKIEQQAPLDSQTILLKAAVQGGAGDAVGALQTLSAGSKRFPKDKTITDAYGKALINAGQTTEGSRYLTQTLAKDPQGLDSLEILVAGAINTKEWSRASLYVERVLELKQDEHTLGQAYTIYHALGDAKTALLVAGKLYALDPGNDQYLLRYLRALVAVGDHQKASALIAQTLPEDAVPATRSVLYYLRAELTSDPNAKLQDLRKALFEDMQNEDVLVAMARYWKKAGDQNQARRYATEARALLPAGKSLPEDLLDLSASGSS